MKIRVHAISPGPLKTRAASGLKDFDLLLNAAAKRAPIGELVDIMDSRLLSCWQLCFLMQPEYGRHCAVDGTSMANMKLWIGNIAPETTDEEIREFVRKYAPDLECTTIQRVEGDGSRPAATLEFADTPYGSVEKISMRLHGMHWKGRELFVQTLGR